MSIDDAELQRLREDVVQLRDELANEPQVPVLLADPIEAAELTLLLQWLDQKPVALPTHLANSSVAVPPSGPLTPHGRRV